MLTKSRRSRLSFRDEISSGFWLVFEGKVNANVKRAMASAGISLYEINSLEQIIEQLCLESKKRGLPERIKMTTLLSVMSPEMFSRSYEALYNHLYRLVGNSRHRVTDGH
jgi:hypothetical protein